jgi:hypothetical protein
LCCTETDTGNALAALGKPSQAKSFPWSNVEEVLRGKGLQLVWPRRCPVQPDNLPRPSNGMSAATRATLKAILPDLSITVIDEDLGASSNKQSRRATAAREASAVNHQEEHRRKKRKTHRRAGEEEEEDDEDDEDEASEQEDEEGRALREIEEDLAARSAALGEEDQQLDD